MTKADLVEEVADVVGPRVIKKDCGLVVDAVKDAMARGDHIEIRGFGTFTVRHRKARTARNPRTGEPVEVPPRVAPVFQPSILLRDRVTRGNISPEATTRSAAESPDPRCRQRLDATPQNRRPLPQLPGI